MNAQIRRLVPGELAIAAEMEDNIAYNLAVAANRLQGRLLEHADGRPRYPGIAPPRPAR